MAYAMKLSPRTCQICGKPARVEVFNRVNSSSGRFCADCGKGEVERLNALEAKL